MLEEYIRADELLSEFRRSHPKVPPKADSTLYQSQDLATQVQILGRIGAIPKEDDPLVDWREFGDEIEEPDLSLEEEEEDIHAKYDGVEVVPDTQVSYAPRGLSSNDLDGWSLGSSYYNFLTVLCTSTSTTSVVGNVLGGIRSALIHGGNHQIKRELSSNDDHTSAYAWVVCVWLTACLRGSHQEKPDVCTRYCGTYFLAAHKIVHDRYNLDVTTFRYAVQHWERVLTGVQRGGWLKDD